MKKRSTVIINGNRRPNLRIKLAIAILCVLIATLLCRYTILIKISNDKLAEQASNFYRLNAQTVFSIDKIYLYSSANAVQKRSTRPSWNMDLYQYTDIAIYINNKSDQKLTYENSIKSLYIDNVKFTEVSKGETSLYYKNANDFGKSVIEKALEGTTNTLPTQNTQNDEQNQENAEASNQEQTTNENTQNLTVQQVAENEEEKRNKVLEDLQKDKITNILDFSILNDGDVDYSKPQLYADCSTPITLEYVNNKIKENDIISDINNEVVFDGNVLRRGNIVLSDIACTVSFNINIINNYDQKFVANVYIDIPLEDTTTGDNIYKGKFVKKLENTNLIRFFRLE